ncbi:MAG: TIGR03032 family protein [Leptolyngbya sp. SIO1D8]|nr:TIGR03032 family protein [Leptolyngbya sp. SIO1D8]
MVSFPTPATLEPLRSVHTTNFPDLLNQLGISLAVSTYQAGKVVLIRADGETLNTHFRMLQKPMGLAVDETGKMAIGTSSHIWEFRNVPAVAPKLDSVGNHDACFLPRNIHVTGDIDIHEMAWGNEGLWFVNTRFSCLCTQDLDHSFVPRWRPPFVSAYAPDDRCHLNGLELVEGRPKYVTALGTTDTASGWRAHKAHGGILMDVTTNGVLAQGLSMPHSPRWYRNQLWVLESGNGNLSTVDLATGHVNPFVWLPGFTRGLDFYGPLAFVGLSQVRESAVFSDIPLTQRLTERICGVWVINIETGQTLAFLRFEDAVQEIFAVQVLPGMRFPELFVNENEFLKTSYVLPDAALAEVELSEVPLTEAEQCFQAARQAHQLGQLKVAAQHYQRGIDLAPQQMTARYQLGVILVDLHQWQAGTEQLTQVIEERPDHVEAHNSLGVAYLNLDNKEKAKWHFERAIALNSNFAPAYNNLRTLQQQ